MRPPGTIRHRPGRCELLPIDRHCRFARRIQRTTTRPHLQGERDDVGGLDLDGVVSQYLRIQPSAFPVLAERVERYPLHPVVSQCPCGEPQFSRITIAPAFSDCVNYPINLDL